jgi:hypothetical protein
MLLVAIAFQGHGRESSRRLGIGMTHVPHGWGVELMSLGLGMSVCLHLLLVELLSLQVSLRLGGCSSDASSSTCHEPFVFYSMSSLQVILLELLPIQLQDTMFTPIMESAMRMS